MSTEQYFLVVMFIMPFKVVVTLSFAASLRWMAMSIALLKCSLLTRQFSHTLYHYFNFGIPIRLWTPPRCL